MCLILAILSSMGAPKWPPSPRRSERPGKAVALLFNPCAKPCLPDPARAPALPAHLSFVHLAGPAASGEQHRSPRRSTNEPVQLASVLADDLVAHLGGQPAQLALDELARVRPYPVRVGKVRSPHDGIVS